MSVYARLRWLLATLLLVGVAIANFATFPDTSLWRTKNQAFRTAEIVKDPPWVKGTATLLAEVFESVRVLGLGEGKEALLFDSELAAIYAIETDSTQTALDLADFPQFERALADRDLIRFKFETFCRVAEAQYCPLTLVWQEQASSSSGPVEFEAVRIAKSKFALIEKTLLGQLAAELNLDLNKRVPN